MITLGDIFGAGGVAGLFTKVAERVWPDPLERAKQQYRLLELQQAGEFKEIDAAIALATAQTTINAEEAKSESVFVSGWRPGLGWVMVAACAWNWVGVAIVRVGCVLVEQPCTLASADLTEMLPILIGMLGLGGLRTYEKIRGVDTK